MQEVNRALPVVAMAGVVVMAEDQIRVSVAGVVDQVEIVMVVEGVLLMGEEGDMETRAVKVRLHMVLMSEVGDMEAMPVLLLPMVVLVVMQFSTRNHRCLRLLLEEAMQTHLLLDMAERLVTELLFHLLLGMVPRMPIRLLTRLLIRLLIAMVHLLITVHKGVLAEAWDMIITGQKSLVDIKSQGAVLVEMTREM